MNLKTRAAVMHDRRTLQRKLQLLTNVPEVYAAKTILYIGVNAKRMEMLDLFFARDCTIDVVEIWPKNVARLRSWDKKRGRFRHIVEANVLDLPYEREYDLALWWHGPEHVRYPDQFVQAVACLERASVSFVVLACPWGECPQDDAYGNPHERHLRALYPKDLERYGYETNCIGRQDTLGSNLLAWKRLE